MRFPHYKKLHCNVSVLAVVSLIVLLLYISIYSHSLWQCDSNVPIFTFEPHEPTTPQLQSVPDCTQNTQRTVPKWKELTAKRNAIGYAALHCDNLHNSNAIIPFRVFQIGFHRSGTRSLFELFTASGYASAHYQCKYDCSLQREKQVCELSSCFHLMVDNFIHRQLLLHGFCHEYVFYADFGISPMINDVEYSQLNGLNGLPYDIQFDIVHDKYKYFWYQLLDQQYPCSSKFILNIRPLRDWLLSRSEHKAKFVKYSQHIHQYWQIHASFSFRPFKDRNKTNWNTDLSKQEVLRYWTRDWYWYHCQVLAYFKSRNRMHDLLIFDVARDDIQKLVDFFAADGIQLDAKHWKHTNWKHQQHAANMSNSTREIDNILRQCRTMRRV